MNVKSKVIATPPTAVAAAATVNQYVYITQTNKQTHIVLLFQTFKVVRCECSASAQIDICTWVWQRRKRIVIIINIMHACCCCISCCCFPTVCFCVFSIECVLISINTASEFLIMVWHGLFWYVLFVFVRAWTGN